MKMIKCENCGKIYPDNVSNCPDCFQKNKKYIKNRTAIGVVLFSIAAVLMVICFMIAISNNKATSQPDNQNLTVSNEAKTEFGKVSYENFLKVENGMTYDEVVEIFGKEGKVLSEVEITDEMTTTMYYWYDSTGISNCNVTFSNGVVIAKAQIGLN